MKKVLILLCLFGLFGNAIEVYNVSGNATNSLVTKVDGWVQIDFTNLLVPTSSSYEATFGYAGDADFLVVPKPTWATGNNTTSSIIWRQYPVGTGEIISTSILNNDTSLTTFLSSLFTVKVFNVPTSNRVTASFLVRTRK